MESDTAILRGLIEKFKQTVKHAEEIKTTHKSMEVCMNKSEKEILKWTIEEFNIMCNITKLLPEYNRAVGRFNQIMEERNINKKIEEVIEKDVLYYKKKGKWMLDYMDYENELDTLSEKLREGRVPDYITVGRLSSIYLSVLQPIVIRSKEAIGILESLIPLPPSEERDRLNGIKQEIENVENEKIKQDLLTSIKECEHGFYLGSCLITARVIDYVIDKIPGDDINKKIEFLKIKGVIDKEDKYTAEFILKASKKARNYLAHEPGSNVLCAESLSLLGDCVKLVESLEKVEK